MIKKIAAIYAFSTIFSSVSGIEAPDIEQTESGMPQKITEDVVSAEADEEVPEKVEGDVAEDVNEDVP